MCLGVSVPLWSVSSVVPRSQSFMLRIRVTMTTPWVCESLPHRSEVKLEPLQGDGVALAEEGAHLLRLLVGAKS